MATALTLPPPPPKLKPVAVPALDAKLGKGPGKIGVLAFGVVLIIGVIYAGSSLASDLSGVHNTSILPYLLLGLALLVALGFEFDWQQRNDAERHQSGRGYDAEKVPQARPHHRDVGARANVCRSLSQP